MIKEATASAFVLSRFDGVVQVALVWHDRLQEWMPAGGHVESDKHPAEAALREITEETGLVASLIPGPALALPAGFPHSAVAAPWWIVEMAAGPDNHTAGSHVHVDNVFLAWAAASDPVVEPVHQVRWFTAAELADAPGVAEDSRLQAKEVMELIAAGQGRAGAVAGVTPLIEGVPLGVKRVPAGSRHRRAGAWVAPRRPCPGRAGSSSGLCCRPGCAAVPPR